MHRAASGPGSIASATTLSLWPDAPIEARAIVLADKLHNLTSMELDLRDGRAVWSQFHAEREKVLWYYHATIDTCGSGEPRVEQLAALCREVLEGVERFVVEDAVPPRGG